MDYSGGGGGGGGAKAMLAPLSNYWGWGVGLASPLPTPMQINGTSQVKLHTAFFCWQ